MNKKAVPIDVQLGQFKESLNKRRVIDELINGNIDEKNQERKSKRSKVASDSSDSEEEEIAISKSTKKVASKRKKRGTLSAIKDSKKPDGYMNEEFREGIIEPAKKYIEEKVSKQKKTLKLGNKLKAEANQKTAPDAKLNDFIELYYRNQNKTIEQTKKSIQESISKQIDISTEKNDKMKNEEKKKKSIESLKKEKETFFKYDEDDSPFGLKYPFEYNIYNKLLAEFKERESNYRIEARESISKKLSQLKFPELESCDRKYCMEFLREPRGKERPCRRMEECICMIMATLYPDSVEESKPEEGFICREFLLPSEQSLYERRTTNSTVMLPEEVGLCLLCRRLWFTWLFYYYSSNGLEPVEVIHDHINKIDTVGEYSSSYCLPVVIGKKSSGVIGPVVKFSMENYVYNKMSINGSKETVKCVVERNLEYISTTEESERNDEFFFSPNIKKEQGYSV